MEAMQTVEPQPSLKGEGSPLDPNSFEAIKEIFREIGKKQEETDRLMKENAQKAKEDRDDFNRRLGSLTNLFGDVTEAMIAPKICKKFEGIGLIFPRANPNVIFDDEINKISFEVDIVLENGGKAMLIEAKTKLTIDRVNYHIERLEKMRKYADLHGDKRIFLGAVAGIVMSSDVKNYALAQGFFVIEPSGETFNITPPNNNPKEW